MPERLSFEYTWLLPKGTIETLSRQELLARGAMEGFVSGRHKSPYKGFSAEFAEHRQYVPGDNLRDLDWRVYGKSDRYFIKQYIEETNLRATILLDASGSMKYTGDAAAMVDGHLVSKFEYAQHIASALTYLLINQQDAVGLVTFDTDIRRYIPARSRASQVHIILQELHNTHPGGETSVSKIFHNIAERIHRRGIVIIISDLFDNADEIISALHHFNYRRHEILVFHVMAEEELTFPFNKFIYFDNLEINRDRLPIDPKTIKARYLDNVREFVNKIKTDCGQIKADYVPMPTTETFDKALANYLSRRRSGGKRQGAIRTGTR